MQARGIHPIRHICTSCGDICRGPQSDVDATRDDHYDFDDDVYAAYGDGGDDIDVSSFVDLLQGEPRDN